MEKQKQVTTVQYNQMELELRQDKKSDKMIMSMDQLSEALGYKTKREFKQLLEQCPELLEPKYSLLIKVENLENGIVKKRQMRFFTEEGIMEASFLSGTSKAKEFRGFIKEKFVDFKTGKGAVTNMISPEQATQYMIQLNKSFDEIMEYLTTEVDQLRGLYEEIVRIGKNTELKVVKLENRMSNMTKDVSRLTIDIKSLRDESSETRKDMKEIKEKIGLWKS